MTRKTKSYGTNNPLQDVFPSPIISKRQPTKRDAKEYELGQIWVDKETSQIYALSDVSGGEGFWALISPGDSDVDTLTGDTGGARTPTNGNMDLEGGTNITTTGSTSTIKFDMDDAITLATSVESPIFRTSPITERIKVSGTNIEADGTNTNTSITLKTKGTGNFEVDSNGLSLTKVGSKLKIKGGSLTDSIGQAVLVGGVKNVANTNVQELDKVFVSRSLVGLSTALGVLEVVITANVGFEISSKKPATPGTIETGDFSVVDYLIIREL